MNFPTAAAQFLPKGMFNRSPILINVCPQQDVSIRPFKYFHMWSLASCFLLKINDYWRADIRGSKMFKLVQKMKSIKQTLKKLNSYGYLDIYSVQI